MNDKETTSKEKILEASAELFARKGFKGTTVRDICKAANTYQISINYHFGSKENLFKDVLLKAYSYTNEFNVMETMKDLPAEKQLEEIIRTRVICIFAEDKRGFFSKIIAKEISNNYDLIDDIMLNNLKPYFYYVRGVFQGLSENLFDDKELNYFSYLLMSHISLFAIHKRGKYIIFGTLDPTEDQLEDFVQQVKRFMIAAVEKVKEDKLKNVVNITGNIKDSL